MGGWLYCDFSRSFTCPQRVTDPRTFDRDTSGSRTQDILLVCPTPYRYATKLSYKVMARTRESDSADAIRLNVLPFRTERTKFLKIRAMTFQVQRVNLLNIIRVNEICLQYLQMVLTCCTISSTLILHLHPTILHNIQTQTTAVSLLQLVNGEYLAVPSNTVLSASQTRWQVLAQSAVYIKSFVLIFLQFTLCLVPG